MTDLPEPVASFVATVNRHDEEGFLAAFAEDGFVDDWGRVFTGREAIKGWSDGEFIGAQGVLTPEEVQVDGQTVDVVGDWRSTHANGRSRFTFVTTGDRILSMTIREG
ncbi:nuclear transport factor 2 family protein [Aeromicrobium sp. CF4.19]|uniref:nuclear transport factor 2 family protein n=1 Tax=Aeromicrobium sp. CF4.19 TaxID=3373082 RepID=UPI003EE63BF2